MFCPKCGTENRPNARFCKSCGHAFAGGVASESVPLTGASPIEHTFVMRSVGPDDPGRTNVSLPSVKIEPDSSPSSGQAPDNGHHGDGFILGDIPSSNLQLDTPPPGVAAGPESIPDLFLSNLPTSQFPPTLIPPPPASSPPPPSPREFSDPDPLVARTGTPASGTPVISPSPAPLNPTPPGGVPLPPEVAATPFRPVELPVGAPRPMGRQITEMPAMPPKPPTDLFVQSTPATATALPRRAGFPLWLIIGLSAGVIVVLGVLAAIAYFQWATPSPPVASETPRETPATESQPPVNTLPTPPKPAIPENMVAIPGGEYLIGRDNGDFLDPYEKPQHRVTLSAFYIDKTEVTNADYQKFIEATGHPAPAFWVGGRFEVGKDLFPVTGVTLSDAKAYARWAGKRLPTEEEWEVAAHGRTPMAFPWGNNFDPSRANVKASGIGAPVRVGTYPAGASPFGVLDMTGNVWEWTASEASLYPGSQGKPPSWDKPLEPGTQLQIIRGGAFTEEAKRCTVTYRNWVPSNFRSRELGFRCVQDQPPQ